MTADQYGEFIFRACNYKKKQYLNIGPEFLRMLFSSGVKIQRNLGVQSNSKVIVHYTFFRVALPKKIRYQFTI